jgi:heat shock protein HslJ
MKQKNIIEDPKSYKISGNYNVTRLGNLMAPKKDNIRFEISEFDHSIRGTTSCNSFSGTIVKDNQRLRVTNISISEKYCNDSIMKSEQTLIDVLQTAHSYTIKDMVLYFYSGVNNNAILTATKDSVQ